MVADARRILEFKQKKNKHSQKPTWHSGISELKIGNLRTLHKEKFYKAERKSYLLFIFPSK